MRVFPLLLLAMVVACSAPPKPGQKTFSTPKDAVVALADAARAGNKTELSAIFGPEGEKILSFGDPVMDENSVQLFVAAYDERAQLSEEEGKRVLFIGNQEWPFPIPLVKDGPNWRFDAETGADISAFDPDTTWSKVQYRQ